MLAVAVLGVLVVAGVGIALLDGDEKRAQLPTGTTGTERPDRAAATSELLFELENAFTGEAGGSPAEVSDPDVGSSADEVAAIRANVRDLRIDRLMLRYLSPADLELTPAQRTRFGDDAWVSEVQLSWRFRGVHGAVSTLEVPLVTDWEGDQAVFTTARITGDYRVPLWFTEPLSVRRTPRVLVLAADDSAAQRLERQAETAVSTVQRTLPEWDERLVVAAPATPADFRAASGLSRAASRSIAAVTTTTDGSALERSPVHIYLNPRVFEPLGPVGRQIVLNHEATHVALDATSTTLPLWLSEGMADYVALVGTRLPDVVLAAQIRDLVREDGVPRALPGSGEFAGSNEDIGAWYEAAWLAVRLIADTYGERALLDFYEQAEAAGGTGRAFRDVLGTTERSFRRAWQADLAELAELAEPAGERR